MDIETAAVVALYAVSGVTVLAGVVFLIFVVKTIREQLDG